MHFRGKKAFGALIFIAVFAGCSAIVMLLWNVLIPTIIGWASINYWQSAGLIILCRLLLGGLGKMGGHWAFNKRKMDQRQMMMMHERISGMPRNERKEYIRRKMEAFENEFKGKDGSTNSDKAEN